MKLIYWSNFSKRKNSTKRPTGGTEIDVVLKDNTSLLNPIFQTDNVPANVNYCYVADFGRYYSVSGVSHDGPFCLIDCECDVLATYKSQIGGTSALVEFTSSSSDVTITDPRNIPTGVFDTTYDTLNYLTSPFNKTGCYIIAVLNSGGGGTGIGTYYALTDNEFLSFKGEVYDTTVLGQITDQFTQVRDSFVSCIWVPLSISSIQGIDNSPIKIGRITLPIATGKMITDRKISASTGATALTFPSGAGAGANLEYIDRPPYTTGYILLPFIGTVPLDMEPAAMFKSLQVETYIDVITGDIVYRLSYGGGAFSTYNGNLATKTPISASSYDAVGVATGVLTTIGGVIGAVASAGAGAAAAMAAGGAIVGGVSSVKKSMELHSMINGSASSAIGAELGISPAWVIHQYIPSMTDLDSIQSSLGLPYNKIATINTLSGYVKCSNASVDIPGYPEEKDMVNGYVNGGFYYE